MYGDLFIGLFNLGYILEMNRIIIYYIIELEDTRDFEKFFFFLICARRLVYLMIFYWPNHAEDKSSIPGRDALRYCAACQTSVGVPNQNFPHSDLRNMESTDIVIWLLRFINHLTVFSHCQILLLFYWHLINRNSGLYLFLIGNNCYVLFVASLLTVRPLFFRSVVRYFCWFLMFKLCLFNIRRPNNGNGRSVKYKTVSLYSLVW